MIRANCLECRGACCEEFEIPHDPDAPADDVSRWFALHGRPVARGPFKYLRFECSCTKLENGLCSIYSTRPQACADFVAGGATCVEIVRRRRSPEQVARILKEDS